MISEILAINTPSTLESYGFELLTKNLSYFCGEFNNSDTKEWELAIRKVYMPVLNDKMEPSKLISGDKNNLESNRAQFDGKTKQTNRTTPMAQLQEQPQKSNTKHERSSEDKIITITGSKENESSNQQSDFDISLQYQIFPDEILGNFFLNSF